MTYGEDEVREVLNTMQWPITVSSHGGGDDATISPDQVNIKDGLRTEIHVNSRRKRLLIEFKSELKRALNETSEEGTDVEITRADGKPNHFLILALPTESDPSRPHQY